MDVQKLLTFAIQCRREAKVGSDPLQAISRYSHVHHITIISILYRHIHRITTIISFYIVISYHHNHLSSYRHIHHITIITSLYIVMSIVSPSSSHFTSSSSLCHHHHLYFISYSSHYHIDLILYRHVHDITTIISFYIVISYHHNHPSSYRHIHITIITSFYIFMSIVSPSSHFISSGSLYHHHHHHHHHHLYFISYSSYYHPDLILYHHVHRITIISFYISVSRCACTSCWFNFNYIY